MTEHTPTAADLYRQSLTLLLEKNIPGWVALWDEDGVLEFPFAPGGWPTRLEGKEDIAEYMRHYPDHIDMHDFVDVQIHQTDDPKTAVVEMRGTGRLAVTGADFEARYIVVVTAENGRIVACRDYWNPSVAQQPGADFTRSN